MEINLRQASLPTRLAQVFSPLIGAADLRPVQRSETLKTGPVACLQFIPSPAIYQVLTVCQALWVAEGALAKGAEILPMKLTF